jgi:hypothetical protein
MDENDRDADNSRFDTAPLQKIGRDDLTCIEVEDFLESAIMAGRGEDEEYEIASMSTTAPAESMNRLQSSQNAGGEPRTATPTSSNRSTKIVAGIPSKVVLHANGSKTAVEKLEHECIFLPPAVPLIASTNRLASSTKATIEAHSEPLDDPKFMTRGLDGLPTVVTETHAAPSSNPEVSSFGGDSSHSDENLDDKLLVTPPSSPKSMLRKYFWGGVALGSFTLGVGCLLMAMGAFDQRPHRRKYNSVSPNWR